MKDTLPTELQCAARQHMLSKGYFFTYQVFEHDEILTFEQQFLSIIISTNRVIFTGNSIVRIRIVMLTTQVKPYEGIVDLFILDPDG